MTIRHLLSCKWLLYISRFALCLLGFFQICFHLQLLLWLSTFCYLWVTPDSDMGAKHGIFYPSRAVLKDMLFDQATSPQLSVLDIIRSGWVHFLIQQHQQMAANQLETTKWLSFDWTLCVTWKCKILCGGCIM
jgi:hypothetical protein